MDFSLLSPHLDKFLLFFIVIILTVNWVKIMGLPVSLSSLSSKDLLISYDLVSVVLKILI